MLHHHRRVRLTDQSPEGDRHWDGRRVDLAVDGGGGREIGRIGDTFRNREIGPGRQKPLTHAVKPPARGKAVGPQQD